MNTTTILIIIAAFFGGSFLLMIPFAIFYSKKKKRVERYKADNADKAILHIYGGSVMVDGRQISDVEHIKGNELECLVPLSGGKHIIEAKYEITDLHLGKNVTFKTPKAISSEIEFVAGCEYTISIYFYSPKERRAYYKGDVGEDVYTQELGISVAASGYDKAYIICYKES